MNVIIPNTMQFENKVDWTKVREAYPNLNEDFVEITDGVHSADRETEKAIHICTQSGYARNTTSYKWVAKSVLFCIRVSFPNRMRDGGAKLVPQEDDVYYYAPRWVFYR